MIYNCVDIAWYFSRLTGRILHLQSSTTKYLSNGNAVGTSLGHTLREHGAMRDHASLRTGFILGPGWGDPRFFRYEANATCDFFVYAKRDIVTDKEGSVPIPVEK